MQNQQMTLKPGETFGCSMVTSSIVITMNLEFNFKKRCIKKESMTDSCEIMFERIIENSRDEEVCRAWDVLAEQDHTYHMSEEEYFNYRQNWWISLNKSGNDTQ